MEKLNRLLILSSEFPPGPGGIGTHAYQLARHFTAEDYAVRVVSPQDYAPEAEVQAFNQEQEFEITTLPSHQLELVKSIRRLHVFIRAVQNFRPQMVIASGSRAIWLSGLILPVCRIPWVVVGHGTEFGARTGLNARITRWSANRADGIICVSAFTQKSLHSLGVTKPAGFVIHNGADEQTFYPLPRADVETFRSVAGVADKFVLLTVGNVSRRKGQEVVIRALPQVLTRHPEVIYWMAGLPQDRDTLEKLASDLGISHAIQFWGRVDNDQLRRLYNACDLFVMTSRQLSDGDFEGYGIAVLEAALCGKPALVSDNSGLAEAVQAGVTGVIVPQNDPGATAEAILLLADELDKLIALGAQAQRNALENQTWDNVVKRYRVILKDVFQASQERSS